MAPDRGDELSRLLADAAWVRTLALRLVGDAHRADDLSQETLLAALSQPHPGPDEPRRSWLAGVLRNLARMQRRQSKRRAVREQRAARAEAAPSTDEVVEQTELQQRVVAEVLALAEPYRGTLLLRYMRGMSFEAIAGEQGVTAATVRSRAHRGIAMLRTRMASALGPSWRSALLPLAIPVPSPPATLPATPTWAAPLVLGVSMKLTTKALLATAATVGLVLVSLRTAADEPSLPQHPTPHATEPATAMEAAERSPSERDRIEPLPGPTPPATRASRHSGPGTVLAGTIVTRDDQPIENADVTVLGAPLDALRSGTRMDPAARTTTDAQGAFTVPGLPASVECVVSVTAEGYASAWSEVRPGDGVVIRLDRAGRVWGVVLDGRSHQPVAGVHIRTRSVSIDSGRLALTTETVSDADGRYALQGLASATEVMLEVLHPGSTPLVQRVLLQRDSDTRHDIMLPDHGTLQGTVVSRDDQRPVSGASIRSGSADPRVLTRTDHAGRFALRLLGRPEHGPRDAMLRGQRGHGADSLHSLAIHASGYCQTIQPVGPLLAADGPTEIALVPAGSIRGVVVDGAGGPVAGATLDWLAPGQILVEPGAWVEPGPTSLRTTTAGDGTFTLEEVLPGIPGASLAVRRPHHAPHRALDVGPDRAGEVRELRIELDTGVTVRGQTQVDGAPERCYVHLTGSAGPASGVMIRTDADGRFSFHGVLPGDYTLKSCTADGTAVWSDPVSLQIDSAAPTPVTLSILAALDLVSGHVVTADGQPLADHEVFAFPGAHTSGILAGMSRTDATGAFDLRLADDSVSSYTLAIPWQGFRVFVPEVRPGARDVRVTAPAVVPVTLVLTRKGTREPIPAAVLAVRRSGEPWASLFGGREVPTTPAGEISVRLPEGEVELRIDASAAGMGTTTRVLRASAGLHTNVAL